MSIRTNLATLERMLALMRTTTGNVDNPDFDVLITVSPDGKSITFDAAPPRDGERNGAGGLCQ